MADCLKTTQFWLVWHEDGGQPHRRHFSKQDAVNEAERLAKTCPGEVFYALKAIAGIVADEPATHRVNFVPDDLPF